MKNRNPVLSFFLSLFISGLGQLYNGEPRKAFIYLILIFPIYLILGLFGILSSFMGFIVLGFIALAYKLFVAIEAFRMSKKLNPYTLKDINKVLYYFLFGIASYGIIWSCTLSNQYLIGHEFLAIPTPSMLPTIELEDRVVATSIKPNNVKVGDIITFRMDDGMSYLSRAIALENESISIQNDVIIFENGEEVLTKTNKHSDGMFEYQNYNVLLPNQVKYSICKIEKVRGNEYPQQKKSNIEKLVVPDGHIYVVSDNRNNGMDSRFYGTIPKKNVEKVIRYVWWSDDLNRIGVNLER